MRVKVRFYSYFREQIGCGELAETLPENATVADLLGTLRARFPGFGALEKSALVAVGVDYQDRSYRLKEGDEISLFPPVQGG